MRYIFIILLISFCSCRKASDRPCFKSSGSLKTITYKIAQSDTISIFDNIDLNIYQSNRNEMEVSCGENLLNFIEVKDDGKTLQIRNKNKCNFLRNERDKVKIDMYIPNFSMLRNQGFGNILIPKKFSTSTLRFLNYGYGDLDVNVDLTGGLFLILAAGNKNTARGKADSFYTYVIGENYLSALELKGVKDGIVSAFTNIDIYLAVDSLLTANQVGKGTVYYKGNPTIISKTPTAKIVKLD